MAKKTSTKEKKKNVFFETSTIINKNEFQKFQKFYLNKFKNNLIPKIFMVILAILAIILNYIKGNFMIVIMLIIFCIIYPIVLYIGLNRQITKMYSNYKRFNVLEEKLTFYDNYFVSKSRLNFCEINYNDVYMICETKENFYVFIGDNKAFIVIKDNLDDIEKFRDFVIEKTKYRRYR